MADYWYQKIRYKVLDLNRLRFAGCYITFPVDASSRLTPEVIDRSIQWPERSDSKYKLYSTVL